MDAQSIFSFHGQILFLISLTVVTLSFCHNFTKYHFCKPQFFTICLFINFLCLKKRSPRNFMQATLFDQVEVGCITNEEL